MIKHRSIIILWLLFICMLPVFSGSMQDSLLNRFVTNVENFNRNFPQEKVYLHLDNTGYFMGETIWFKAYVFRDDRGTPTDLSGVLYVELVDPMGEVVQTHKLEIKDGQADGQADLKGLLNSGFYEIRAYTRYMTNWDNTGMFSRVLPILNEPDSIGNWTQRTMDMYSYEHRLPSNREIEEEATKKMNVSFYPEGGHLISGMKCRVAFSVTDRNGAHFETSGWLEERGRKVCDVKTLREGRGVFECSPSSDRMVLHLPDSKGTERTFNLPKAEEEGCVLSVDTKGENTVTVSVSATTTYNNHQLGFIAMHQGKVMDFRILTLDGSSSSFSLAKQSLGDGVSQLALIDCEGNVLAERMVFVFPSTSKAPIHIDVENEYLKPYGKIELSARTVPNATFSLSVRDYDTQINGWEADALSWKLLASDLKGYIENARYYFEADDLAHREAADLLMLVQGWRRYSLPSMMGLNSFSLQQRLESSLCIEGKIFDKRNLKEKRKDEGELDIYVTAMNRNTSKGSAGGLFGTEADGSFIIPMSRYYGNRDFIFRPEVDGDITKFEYSFNRWFSPPTRHIYKNETFPLPVDTPKVWLGWRADTTALHLGQREYMLEMVEVKGKRNRSALSEWRNEKRGSQYASLYYDCKKENDIIRDSHQKSPDFLKWLKMKNSFFGGNWGNDHEDDNGNYRNERLRVMPRDGVDYKRRPVIWIINNGFYCLSFAPKKMSEKNITSSTYTPEDFPATLDEVRTVYVSEDEKAWRTALQMPELEPYRPVTVYIYKSYYDNHWESLRKGIRSITMAGFDKPQTFESPEYNILPAIPDHRRTLYWNPNVKTDGNGEAKIYFYNNRDCRQIVVSAEGFTSDGNPIVY